MDRVKSRGTNFREKEKENQRMEGISSPKESSTGMEEDTETQSISHFHGKQFPFSKPLTSPNTLQFPRTHWLNALNTGLCKVRR